MGTRKIGRDAKTGEFIPVKEAQRRPNTTVIQFAHPRLATQLRFARCVVSAWGGEAAMQSAAARWIMRAR